MNIDINCFVGHWPSRKIRKGTFGDLLALHRANGIDCGYVSSLDSIFYNDPLEGDMELCRQLEGSGYRLVATVNPLLPAFDEDVAYADDKLKAAAVRVYPCYHDYTLDCPEFIQLCELLQDRGLPLFITSRLEDERLEYIIRAKPTPVADAVAVAERFPRLQVVLLGYRREELVTVAARVCAANNLLFDTSGLKNNLFAVDKTVAQFGADKLVFGSQHPLYCLTGTLLKVQKSECSHIQKLDIMGGNAARLQ